MKGWMLPTGEPAALRVTVDRAALRADGADLAFVRAEIVDRDGLVVPRAKPLLRFTVTGAADLVATDNGDPTDHRAFASAERLAYNGLALVRPRSGAGGSIALRVECDGLDGAELRLEAIAPPRH